MDILGIDEIESMNTPVDDTETEVINLIFVAIDGSGSMGAYIADMKNSLNEFKDALLNSKEVDEILLARADFADDINVGGYKPVDQFDINYGAGGMTVLYDVIIEGSNKLLQYIDYLKKQGMRVKAVFSVFSDGADTTSKHSINEAKNCVLNLQKQEVTTAFISFGSGKGEADRLKFQNSLTVGSSASELRKAFNTLSKSVIDHSKSATSSTDSFFDM